MGHAVNALKESIGDSMTSDVTEAWVEGSDELSGTIMKSISIQLMLGVCHTLFGSSPFLRLDDGMMSVHAASSAEIRHATCPQLSDYLL
jgi:hypothetical protein